MFSIPPEGITYSYPPQDRITYQEHYKLANLSINFGVSQHPGHLITSPESVRTLEMSPKSIILSIPICIFCPVNDEFFAAMTKASAQSSKSVYGNCLETIKIMKTLPTNLLLQDRFLLRSLDLFCRECIPLFSCGISSSHCVVFGRLRHSPSRSEAVQAR